LDTAVEATKKTSAAVDVLTKIGAYDDVKKAAASKQIRAGKGKMRNRRHTLRRGPLIVYASNDGVEQAFRNLPGVELCCVDRLNLLQLAPGGHMGRFCVWSQAALEKLDEIYGDEGKRIPTAAMTNADLARIINSDEIQSVLNPAKTELKKYARKANPLRNREALEKLDPYEAEVKRASAAAAAARVGKKAELMKKKRAADKDKKQYKAKGKAFYEAAATQGDVCEGGFNL
jgi:large subunit ribosomal protein L4e